MTNLGNHLYSERPYREADLQSLDKIEKTAGDASWSRAEIAHNATDLGRETRVITANDNREIVGFYVVEYDEFTLYICNIAVSPEWRRKGVGSFAMQAIESLARSLNYRGIELDVQESNLAAQLLYKFAGFEAVQIRKQHYQDQDGYRMIKKLDLAKK